MLLGSHKRSDAGSAFMTVMATTTILFVLATTLMMMVAYQTETTRLRTGRLRATHVADAGVNAYLFQLKADHAYYRTVSDTGWITLDDGEKYRVTATPASGTTPLTLRSTGVAQDGTVTVAATVRFPGYGDYMFLTNADLSIAGDAEINGSIRSNGNIDNQGKIAGKALASGSVSGLGRVGQGTENGVPVVDFNTILTVMDDIATSARASGTYFGASGAYGYRVTVSGNTVLIAAITGGTTTGDLVTTPLTMITIPSSGVMYFDDDIWIVGNYSVPLTVVSNKNIYLTDDYAPTSLTSTATSGLIAKNNIIVPAWYKSVKNDMTINAALLSQSGRVYADVKQGVTRDRIKITGSIAAFDSGGTWGSYDKFTGQPIAGFRQNVYYYDQRLIDSPPPLYPVVWDGSLKVDTWVEDRTQTF